MVWFWHCAEVRLLLDTHVFLWWNEGSPRLSRKVSRLLADPENTLFLSVVSAWEMILKVQAGKLKLPSAVGEYIEARIAHYGMEPLPITLAHALASGRLPTFHRDPFDRMLIAQGQVEQLIIVTHDAQLRRYAVETVW